MAGVLHVAFADVARERDPDSFILSRLKASQIASGEDFSGLLVLDMGSDWPSQALEILTDLIGTTYVDAALVLYRGDVTRQVLDDWTDLRSRRRHRMQVLWVPDLDGCLWTGDSLEVPTIPPPTGEANGAYLMRLLSDDNALRAMVEELSSTHAVSIPGIVAHAVDTRRLATEVVAAAKDVASGHKGAASGAQEGKVAGLDAALPARLLNAAGHSEGEWKRKIRSPIQRLEECIAKLESNGGNWASVSWFGGLFAKGVVADAREDMTAAGESARDARRAAEDALSKIDPADFVDHAELEVMDSVLERPALRPEEDAEMQAAPARLRQATIERLRSHGAIPVMKAELEQIKKRVTVRTGDDILSQLQRRCDNGQIALAIQAASEPVGFPKVSALSLFGLAGVVAGAILDQGTWFVWAFGLVIVAAIGLVMLHPSKLVDNLVSGSVVALGGMAGVLLGRVLGAASGLDLPAVLGILISILLFGLVVIMSLSIAVRQWLREVKTQTEYLAKLPAAMAEVLDLARREWHFANERIRVGRMADALWTALAGAQESLSSFGANEAISVAHSNPNSDSLLLEAKVFASVEQLDGIATVQLGNVVQRIVARSVSDSVERIVSANVDSTGEIDYSEAAAAAVTESASSVYERLVARGIVDVISSGGYDEAEEIAVEMCRGAWAKSDSRVLLSHPSARTKMLELCSARQCELLDEDPEATRIVMAYPRGYLFSASIPSGEGRAIEYSRPDHLVLLRLTPVRIEKLRPAISLPENSERLTDTGAAE